MDGKLILIEGTDCSGKETQTKLLVKRLIMEGYKVSTLSFPVYDSPTGRIVGGPYLGKPSICESYFLEGTVNADPKVVGHYYAADRLAHKPFIEKCLDNGEIVILDRYVESNMAHQGSKISNKKDRLKFYKWCHNMEYINNELPKPELTLFLHLPYLAACDLKDNREELDQHEKDGEHLQRAEQTYVELADLYEWTTIDCLKPGSYRSKSDIKTIEEINDEIYITVNNILNNKGMVK